MPFDTGPPSRKVQEVHNGNTFYCASRHSTIQKDIKVHKCRVSNRAYPWEVFGAQTLDLLLSSSPPLPHAAPLAPSPTHLSTSSPSPQSTAEVMSWRGRPAQSFFSKVKGNLVSKLVLRCSITTIPLMYIILHYLIIIIF